MATGRVPTTANSPLTAKGDLFGYSTTQARVPVGSNGDTLVADSSTSTGLRWQSPKSLNGCINGGFDIWQRGTSFAPSASTVSTYTADRWIFFRSGLVTGATLSRQSIGSLGTTPAQSIQYAARIQRDSGNTSTQPLQFTTSFESANSYQYAGQAVTLSFYARAGANFSATSSLFNVSLVSGTGTDQLVSNGFTGAATPISNTVTLTTSWQRFQATATVSTAATQLGITTLWTPTGTAGANDWVEITGVQLELGAIATPFQRSGGTLAGELAACQRYYYRATGGGAFFGVGSFAGTSANGAEGFMTLPVPMRVAPTGITVSGNFIVAATAIQPAVTIDTNTTSRDRVGLVLASTGNFAQYRAIYLLSNNNANNFIETTGTEL